jgi:hypothetical protein
MFFDRLKFTDSALVAFWIKDLSVALIQAAELPAFILIELFHVDSSVY